MTDGFIYHSGVKDEDFEIYDVKARPWYNEKLNMYGIDYEWSGTLGFGVIRCITTDGGLHWEYDSEHMPDDFCQFIVDVWAKINLKNNS